MAKKGEKFNKYKIEFKVEAIEKYESKIYGGYKKTSKEMGIKNKSQLQKWVKVYRDKGIEGLEDKRGVGTKSENAIKGRPRTKFGTQEDEIKYLKMQVEYLKKLQVYGKKVKIRDKYKIIKEMQVGYKNTVKSLCCYGGISRSGYYKWLNSINQVAIKDDDTEKIIVEVYNNSGKTYGRNRISKAIKNKYGLIINHKKVYRIMKELGIRSLIRKKKKIFKGYESMKAPNVLKRDFKASKINEKWTIDVSYLTVPNVENHMYLCAIKDMYTKEIVSYTISKKNDNKLVMDTVYKAREGKDSLKETILHSDQGYQFTSYEYSKTLKDFNITQSMSRRGNCLDNAPIESFFSQLKTEFKVMFEPRSKDDYLYFVFQYINYYNKDRIQKSLNYQSPYNFKKICS